ncbi:phenylacetate--CoA ligase family protein [Qiania dongpingensis]|uniref:Phenylacetate--CoA ligase family protein n=1 Tax=Qiania dongpingensis TaxID=2763669 RepID=A0A7G9G3C4_9FIRM|nr:phenylacetate--CoA ligase family protein [Qiania dongpingensis]QNM05306.1 phenylacetate--CoA ligase family protein [Qiania dongpingensis]
MNYLNLLWELYTLKQNEKKTCEEMAELQQKKLRHMLAFAYEQSGYYRKAFEAAGITKQSIQTAPLSQFPVLTKAELLAHFDELVTVPDLTQEEMRRFDAEEAVDRKPFKGKYHVVHSSGSTGKPGYFLYDDAAWSHMLLGIIRGALWGMSMLQILKLLARGPRIAYLAATDGRYGGAMAVGDGIDGVHAKQMYLDIKTPLAEWIGHIQEFKPNMIIGYPSAIKILAELVERGEVECKVFRVISCGEPLGSSLRHYLEKTFHAEVVNFYGASESLALGAELDPRDGMVLFDDMNVIEAEDGHMYLTSLYNFAQPLIRYEISDHLTLQKPDRSSRYPFSKAVGLLGRNEDVLWFTDGNGNREFLHPLAIEGFCIEGLLDYQFQQTSLDTFEMLAETSAAASRDEIRREMLEQMSGILKEKKLSYVQFYVRFVDEITPDPQTGKKRLIVNSFEEERPAV